jgi:Glycosyl transferase family 2
MSRPFVTVLIDTYNHEAFIEEAVNSVLEQDFDASAREILVVDDGSLDRTPEVVRKFEPGVRLLRKSNGGQGSAFNLGISEARGEIVAFLDGDDWWVPGKLVAVTEAFAANPEVGLVGHGLTEVYGDGRLRVEMPWEVCRFRISSAEAAKRFRMLRGFLGTSRMAYRRTILRKIGLVPEVLTFEADEYLFTLAGFFSEVLVLPKSFTFYRLHGANLYQLAKGNDASLRRKQRVIAALLESLRRRFTDDQVPREIARPILECLEVEAEVMRLRLDSGFPWETVSAELKLLRVFHSDASLAQHLFSTLRLLPAILMSSRSYYQWRSRLAELKFYQALRRAFMPFPVPKEVKRIDKAS